MSEASKHLSTSRHRLSQRTSLLPPNIHHRASAALLFHVGFLAVHHKNSPGLILYTPAKSLILLIQCHYCECYSMCSFLSQLCLEVTLGFLVFFCTPKKYQHHSKKQMTQVSMSLLQHSAFFLQSSWSNKLLISSPGTSETSRNFAMSISWTRISYLIHRVSQGS